MGDNIMDVAGAIEHELSMYYMPGAIQYIDKYYDDAWSKAIDRFDKALVRARDSKSWELIKLEAEIYRRTILQLIDIYKVYKRGSKVEQFLDSIRIKDR